MYSGQQVTVSQEVSLGFRVYACPHARPSASLSSFRTPTRTHTRALQSCLMHARTHGSRLHAHKHMRVRNTHVSVSPNPTRTHTSVHALTHLQIELEHSSARYHRNDAAFYLDQARAHRTQSTAIADRLADTGRHCAPLSVPLPPFSVPLPRLSVPLPPVSVPLPRLSVPLPPDSVPLPRPCALLRPRLVA